jgi:hypothetical protein
MEKLHRVTVQLSPTIAAVRDRHLSSFRVPVLHIRQRGERFRRLKSALV